MIFLWGTSSYLYVYIHMCICLYVYTHICVCTHIRLEQKSCHTIATHCNRHCNTLHVTPHHLLVCTSRAGIVSHHTATHAATDTLQQTQQYRQQDTFWDAKNLVGYMRHDSLVWGMTHLQHTLQHTQQDKHLLECAPEAEEWAADLREPASENEFECEFECVYEFEFECSGMAWRGVWLRRWRGGCAGGLSLSDIDTWVVTHVMW
jgi:hypothetical protein